MSKDRVTKRFYPNGQIETEIRYLAGIGTSWVTKFWHPNGVLASEVPVKNGVPEGMARFWNNSGQLIGSYEVREGTGLQKSWHSDGSLMGEISWVNGQLTGRQRAYLEGGKLLGETYWIRGKRVSRRKYVLACLEDPSLPRYGAGLKDHKLQKQSRGKKPAEVKEAPFINSMLSLPETREVLEWLRSGRPGTRLLGELPSYEESIELAEELYAFGAVKVWAVEIDTDDPELEGTSKLVVSLPKPAAKRARVLKWCGQWAERNGYAPEFDVGQKHVFVALD